jgi:hypothetical protein
LDWNAHKPYCVYVPGKELNSGHGLFWISDEEEEENKCKPVFHVNLIGAEVYKR